MALRFAVSLALCVAATLCAAGETLFIAPDLYSPAGKAIDAAASEAAGERAIEAIDSGRVDSAFRYAGQAVAVDPDNEDCRRLLGYQKVGQQWLTPYQKRQVERGYIWDARFGWLKADDVPRYEAGERRRGRRWLSAADDARLHATIDTGWQVRTDHWAVMTNHSLEAAAGLAAELERLRQMWLQLFGGYAIEASELSDRMSGDRMPRVRSRPMRVVFHATKQQYVAALKHKQPRIAETEGIYFDDLREAHFYSEGPGARGQGPGNATANAPTVAFDIPPSLAATLYHEATHQLFQESRRTQRNVGGERGYWLIEGVATAMETLRASDDRSRYRFAEPDAGRLPAARERVAEGYFVPLAELESLGMVPLQRREDLRSLYSQMAGLGVMLVTADGGARRPVLASHLRALYGGSKRRPTLWEALGEPADEVERAYRRWVVRLPE